MTNILIFGAGGRAGKQAVAEARRRAHTVTAVVRDTTKYPDLAADGVHLVPGDVTDPTSVATLTSGHDAIINAAVDLGPDANAFFTASAHALLPATRTSAARLVVVGLSALLNDATGTPLLDADFLDDNARKFCLGHAAGLDVLRTEGHDANWLYLSPSGHFTEDAAPSATYRITDHGDWSDKITYPDFARALLDEIEKPTHHRMHLAVTC